MYFIKKLLNKVFVQASENAFVQLFRYAFVGGLAFVVDFGLLALLTEKCGMPYLLSACFGFAGGLLANYLLSIKWVFNKQTADSASAVIDFIMFAVIGLIGLGLNALIMWTATEKFGSHYLISKIISTIIVFGWNFIGRRVLITKTQAICQTIMPQLKA